MKIAKELKPKLLQGAIPAFLYKINVSYYDTGTISNKVTGNKLFDYYKADKVTQEQKAKILEMIPLAQFKSSSPEYAPEMKACMVWIPKAAYYKQLSNPDCKRIA